MDPQTKATLYGTAAGLGIAYIAYNAYKIATATHTNTPTINTPVNSSENHRKGPRTRKTRRLAATTKNVEKLVSIRRGFTEFFQDRDPNSMFDPVYEVQACPSESGIPHGQPWGLQHTYEGAAARITDLKKAAALSECEYIVSAENGVCSILTHTQTHAVDICCVVIEHTRTGKQAFSFSQSRPYPLSDVQEKKRRGEKGIGAWCAEFYRTAALPESRGNQIVTATTMALAQLVTQL
jgi:non-canonical (house-cleaning) NTP pyrophosphatase